MRNQPIPPATAIGVLFVAASAVGCARPSPTYVALHGLPPVRDIQRITLEYLGCEGRCPVYTIELHRSGEAHYWDKALVSKVGHYIGVVDSTVFERLAAGLVDRGFVDSTKYAPAILADGRAVQ